MQRDQIEALIPVREPYLWVDEVVEVTPTQIHARKHLPADLPLFAGHYVDFPVFPGALQCECAFQAAAILIAQTRQTTEGRIPVIARVNNVKFRQVVRPGSTLDIHVQLVEEMRRVLLLSGRLSVDGQTTAQLEFAATEADQSRLENR